MVLITLLLAAAVVTGLSARKLCGDPYAALPAAAVYAAAPPVRNLASADLRIAACVLLLPALFFLFHSMTDFTHDEEPSRRRWNLAAMVALTFVMSVLDSRFATTANLAVWAVLLTGFFMDHKRHSRIWGPPFYAWTLTTLFSLLAYAPLWWWRRLSPGAVGGPPAGFDLLGADFLGLWSHSADYLGLLAVVLGVLGLFLSRSYRSQTRLWAVTAGIFVWIGLGARFYLGLHYVWWVPLLYRLVRKIGWFGSIDPAFFAVAGQFALAMLVGFGVQALWARIPPRHYRWARPALAVGAAALIALDGFRFAPLWR